jgi:hypothetical protein
VAHLVLMFCVMILKLGAVKERKVAMNVRLNHC